MNILITGAGRGIGFQAAFQLAQAGHTVIAASRNVSRLNTLRSQIQEIDPRHLIDTIPLDLEEDDSIRDFIPRLQSLVTHLDVVIHNAGMLVNKPFETITAVELQRVYTVNVLGPFRLTQALLPMLGGQERSHIVFIGSMGGVQGSAKFPGLSAYSSSKSAVTGLTEVLAEELKEKNIAVNGLALGAAQTEMLADAFPGYQAPLTASQMAQFIGWFAVNGQLYFNGKMLPVSLSTP